MLGPGKNVLGQNGGGGAWWRAAPVRLGKDRRARYVRMIRIRMIMIRMIRMQALSWVPTSGLARDPVANDDRC